MNISSIGGSRTIRSSILKYIIGYPQYVDRYIIIIAMIRHPFGDLGSSDPKKNIIPTTRKNGWFGIIYPSELLIVS